MNRFGNETISNTITTGSILVKIDGTSRSLLDTNRAFEDYADAGPDVWITTTQVSGTLSFFGSLYVLCSLIGTKQRRSKNLRIPFNRLLLAISIADLMSSLGMMVAGVALPSTPPGDYEGYYSLQRWKFQFPDASGNRGTCQTQGWSLVVMLGNRECCSLDYCHHLHRGNLQPFSSMLGWPLPLSLQAMWHFKLC